MWNGRLAMLGAPITLNLSPSRNPNLTLNSLGRLAMLGDRKPAPSPTPSPNPNPNPYPNNPNPYPTPNTYPTPSPSPNPPP